MKRGAPVVLALAAALSSPALAQLNEKLKKLETYESNSIGWTQDSDDQGFLDVRLSLKYPLGSPVEGTQVYFAATMRFAQYLGTRESSPVLGKRFNPKLIWRSGVPDKYFDIAFAHESNGQSIDSEEEFNEGREIARFLRQPDFHRDYISRGWDYVELAARAPAHGARVPRIDASFRIFLPQGPLQGEAEEYNDWENDPEGKPRRRVHGLAVLATWQPPVRIFASERKLRLAIGMETGYSMPLRHNTLRTEAAMELFGLPFMVFYQDGYANDLSLYYKRGSSAGIALELAAF